MLINSRSLLGLLPWVSPQVTTFSLKFDRVCDVLLKWWSPHCLTKMVVIKITFFANDVEFTQVYLF